MASQPSNPYTCPFCKAIIPITDVNVSTDVALCRACGKAFSFVAISSTSDLSKVDLGNPPPRVTVGMTTDGRSQVVYRGRPILGTVFFGGFALIWSFLSIGGLYGTQIYHHHFDLWTSLFGLPFLAVDCVFISIVALLLFGRWEIVTGAGEGTVFYGVGPLGYRRSFRYSKSSQVAQTDWVQKSGRDQRVVAVTTDGEVFRFGAAISEEGQRFIAAWLQQAFARMQAARA